MLKSTFTFTVSSVHLAREFKHFMFLDHWGFLSFFLLLTLAYFIQFFIDCKKNLCIKGRSCWTKEFMLIIPALEAEARLLLLQDQPI